MTDDDIKEARVRVGNMLLGGAWHREIAELLDRALDALEAARAQVAALTVEHKEACDHVMRLFAERDAAIKERDEAREAARAAVRRTDEAQAAHEKEIAAHAVTGQMLRASIAEHDKTIARVLSERLDR